MPTAPPLVMVAVDRGLADRVPRSIAADGLLNVGTDPSYKPMQFLTADGRLTGLEIQLVQAISAKLDLRARFYPEAFTALESGVRAGRFDVGAGALTLLPDEVLTTDAVIYLQSGVQLARPLGSDLQLADMCGRRIAALEGSQQIAALSDASKQCTAEGRASIRVAAFLSQEEVTRAVLTTRADGMLADSPVVAAAVQSYPGELDLAPGIVDPAPFALLTPAEEQEFAAVVAAAIDDLIAEGAYSTILASFGIRQGAVSRSVVLPAGEPARVADAEAGSRTEPAREP